MSEQNSQDIIEENKEDPLTPVNSSTNKNEIAQEEVVNKSFDQIEQDHNIIAAGYDKECSNNNNNNNEDINMDLGYVKYLNNEEKKTLEQLQDKTQMSIEKYKDIRQQSSQKKNSEIFSECYDPSPSSQENSSQVQSCLTYFQYKPGKQKANQKMTDSYQSENYTSQNKKNLFQQQNSDFYDEQGNSINPNLQSPLFQQLEDTSSQNYSQNVLQGDNFFSQERMSNSISTIKSKGGQSASFINDKSNNGEVYYLASIQESEELGKNMQTNSSSYPHPYIQTNSQQNSLVEGGTNTNVGSTEQLTQFELYRLMKKEKGSKPSTPKSQDASLSILNNIANNKGDIYYEMQEQQKEDSDVLQFSSYRKRNKKQQMRNTPSKSPSQERSDAVYINKRILLETDNISRDPYTFSSGFNFEKHKSISNPESVYTSFKFKSQTNSPGQSRLSPNNQQRVSQDSLKENINCSPKFTIKSAHKNINKEQQCKDNSLTNSMLKSNSFIAASEKLNYAISSPVNQQPRSVSREVKQSKHSKKQSRVKDNQKQPFNKENINHSQSNENMPKNNTDEIQQSLTSPMCFQYLNEASNTSILKNTLIQWFENERIKFQNQIDQHILNQQSLNYIHPITELQPSKFVVSQRELTKMEDFLIEFEIALSQNNGIINSNIESKLSEFLNNEGVVTYNRITKKQTQNVKSKSDIDSQQKLSKNDDSDKDRIQQQNISPSAAACLKIIQLSDETKKSLKNEEDIFNYTLHKKILTNITNSLNQKALNIQKQSTNSEFKLNLFIALFNFLANFVEFIPLVNQKLQNKTWDFCSNILTKPGMIIDAVKKLPQLMEKQQYNKCKTYFIYHSFFQLKFKDLIQEFDEYFWKIDAFICHSEKLLDDIENTYFVQLIYSIKTAFDVNTKKLQVNSKKTEEYLKQREQKIKEGVEINAYLHKSVLSEQKSILEQYGVEFVEWEKNLSQVQKDINTLKGMEKKSQWVEERNAKKIFKQEHDNRDQDDFDRYKQSGTNLEDKSRSNYLQNLENKRERINNSTEIRIIQRKMSTSVNKSIINDQVEKTKEEVEFKKVLLKQAKEQKRVEQIEQLEGFKEKRKLREKQIEELKKTEKEEKVWKRAQELLEKQSRLLYEREQLLQNKQYY